MGGHEVAGYSKTQQFSGWNVLEWGLIAFKMSKNIDKSIVYIITSQVVIFIKVASCTSQPVAFNVNTWALMDV